MTVLDDILERVANSLVSLHRKVDHILTTQDTINAAVADINAQVTALANATAAIGAAFAKLNDEVIALQQANPTVDTTALVQSQAALDAAMADLAKLVPATPVVASSESGPPKSEEAATVNAVKGSPPDEAKS